MKTLTELTADQILETSLDDTALLDMHSPMLVFLLKRMKAKYEEVSKENEQWKKKQEIVGYSITPELYASRCNNQVWERREKIVQEWKAWSDDSTDIPTINDNEKGSSISWDMEKEQVVLTENARRPFSNRFYEATSSALLLYRLNCLFPGQLDHTQDIDEYKIVWRIYLQHRVTGRVIRFGEFKAAISISPLNFPSKENLAADQLQFRTDAFELLDMLFSKQCPHTYDGTIAGSVA